jgi:hypothetical protein
MADSAGSSSRPSRRRPAQHRIGAFCSWWSSSSLASRKRPLRPALKALAALVEISEPNRSSVSEIVQVELLLDGRQVDHAQRPDALDVVGSVDAGLLHRLAGALDDAADAGLADEHVVRFLGQHEAAGARQRIEAGLRQRLELHLAVAVGEEGEHEEDSQSGVASLKAPSMRGAVGIARAARSRPRPLRGRRAEILVQQIDHRPEMAAFLDVHLEQVAHVVERRRGLAEMALLLDRRRLGVALDHDQAAQHGAVLARHFLPGRLALVLAEGDPCGPRPAAQAGCPSGSRASSRSRTWPSPWVDETAVRR